MAGDTRRCPACAEEVLVAAKKCKHCGEWFHNLNEPPPLPPAPLTPSESAWMAAPPKPTTTDYPDETWPPKAGGVPGWIIAVSLLLMVLAIMVTGGAGIVPLVIIWIIGAVAMKFRRPR